MSKCLICLVRPNNKCVHKAYRAVCIPCEWECLRREHTKEVMCPRCNKWLQFEKLQAGKDGYW